MGGIQHLLFLALALHAVAANGFAQLGEDASILRPTYNIDDETELMEPRIVAEPQDGSKWWYTPSRKAHIYRHRFNKALKQLEQQHNPKNTNKQGEDMRLPGDIIPISYDVRMLPFVELIESGNYTTEGSVVIVVECIRSTRNISINSAELVIRRGTISILDMQTNSPLAVVDYFDEQSTREIITIQTASMLGAGKRYKISMSFKSTLNDDLRGFYRSSYIEEGVRKWLAVTQFESTDARRAFPCFDEPSMKANFTVALGRKDTMTAVSNMEQIKSGPVAGMPGYIWDSFAPSVKMSSYLVAFLVSDFINIPAKPGVSNVQFRIWARANAENLTTYAIDIGPRILEYFESYFNIDYPLAKQDMAAIPDFAAGAMENWGLITYRESDLLIDTETASARQKQRVAIVSAHELAHQWFGDLVTMDWWNAIWLNEGFASYMEFIGTDSVEPDFKMNDQFVIENLQYVFGIDALETSRPINIEVNTPAEISSLFDAISYEKGSCIVRMCADMLGIDAFKRGLTRYLNDNAYGNAQQDDLWQAMQEQADEENIVLPAKVKEIMDTWTYKMGYPVIKVTRDYATGGAQVTQERFLLRKMNTTEIDPTVYQWWVPLTYINAGLEPSQKVSEWLSKDDVSTSLNDLGADADQWVIFNVDQQNYYRVAYDGTNYDLLTAQLMADHQRIVPNNRAQLLDDTFILASVDIVPYKNALDLSLYLAQEKEYVPWNAVLAEFNYIDSMLHNQAQFPDWTIHMTNIVTPYYNHVGFQESDTDAQLTIYARTDAMSWACRLKIADCVDNSKAKYAEQMNDPDNSRILSPNQKSTILRTGVENGGQAEWDFAFSQYLSKYDTSFLIAATCSKESSRLYNLLEMMLDSESGIRLSDVNTLFKNVASNPLGNLIATDFLVNRWNDIEQSWLGSNYFVNFFRYVCDRQNTQTQLDRLLKLRNDHFDILGNSNTVQQGIDIVVENIKWMELHQEEIGTWLVDPSVTEPPATTTTSTTTTSTTTTTTTSTTTPSTTTRTSTTTSSSTAASTVSTTPVPTTPSAGFRFTKMDFTSIFAVVLLWKFLVH
ncbi:hypothetical protein OUZ56_003836 [Daphnia magna]|uniref:Protease m1 zinc metalloprotease n=1 Tax=Daphnia magna TaxID=35525 RepID=A0ABQ9YMY3_9CRUS|nr:hypothetical protein OUZ56_003836 [Daphnia magna]